jgi:outer membrane porin, OprD family
LSTNYAGIGWTLGGTTTADNSKLLRPYGVSPSYLSLIVQDFDRPGEDALMLGLSYDFSQLGIKNLSSYMKYARSSTPDTGSFASPDQDELNITFDYKFKKGLLNGLWLRLRYALLDQHGAGAEDLRDYHVILNYSLPIL